LILALISGLSACANLRGVMVPVSGTVPGASQVDMLVATTRKRVDPAEMFSGDWGPTPGFANITVSIPPPSTRQVGEQGG
jgi:esterase/lipase superfamily enzyme